MRSKRVFDCLKCGNIMELKEALPKMNSRGGKKYRVRRFLCNICGEQRTIFADGYIDEDLAPAKAIKAAERLSKSVLKEKRI